MAIIGSLLGIIPVIVFIYLFIFRKMEPQDKVNISYFFNLVFLVLSIILSVIAEPNPGIPATVVMLYLTICFHIGVVAERKGRNSVTFTLFSIIFLPILPGIVVALMKPEVKQVKNELKPCPMCAELVKIEALKCKHCGTLFETA